MQNIQQPKYILLDVGNVLVYKVTHEDDNISKLLNLSREEYRNLLDRLIGEQSYSEKEEFRTINTVEKEKKYLDNLHQKICNHLSVEFDQNFINKMTNCRMKGDFKLKEGTIEALNTLSLKYELGIFSNALPSRRIHELKIDNLDSYFKHIFISKEIGMQKPEPCSYKYVLERIGYNIDDVLFVDDKLDYLEGAKLVGIKNLVLLKNKEVSNEYVIINNLLELVELLNKE